MRRAYPVLALALAAGLAAPQLLAKGAKLKSHPVAEAQTLDLAKQLIALRSVQGSGNKTPEALGVIKGALLTAGWQGSDIEITPFRDTAYMIATWPGSDPSLKPLVISGHMDVVEAKPEDWQRDPFTPVVENGYLFGLQPDRAAPRRVQAQAHNRAAILRRRRNHHGVKPGDRRKAQKRRAGDQHRWRRRDAGRGERQTALLDLAGRRKDL
jgi:hypothetical protein